MGSGKKKQPSYQATESTIAPAIAVLEPVPDIVSPVTTETAGVVDTQSMDADSALVAEEPQEVVIFEPFVQEADATLVEPQMESTSLAASLAADELVTPVTDQFAAEVLGAGAPGKPMLLGGAEDRKSTRLNSCHGSI